MKIFAFLMTATFLITFGNSITFPKINPDSVDVVDSDMHRAHFIFATMKNGDVDTLFSDSDGGLMLFSVSKNNSWFTMSNPNKKNNKNNCHVLLCSLLFGTCMCQDAIIDSGSSFARIAEDEDGGFYFYKKRGKDSKIKKNSGEKQKPIHVSEEEMTKRFLAAGLEKSNYPK